MEEHSRKWFRVYFYDERRNVENDQLQEERKQIVKE